MINPNWYNTLHGDFTLLGHIEVMGELAKTLRYPYFMWNGRIYTSSDWKDTGFTTRDLPPLART